MVVVVRVAGPVVGRGVVRLLVSRGQHLGGKPTAVASAGTSWVTTELAPMRARGPIVTGPTTLAPVPIDASAPMVGPPGHVLDPAQGGERGQGRARVHRGPRVEHHEAMGDVHAGSSGPGRAAGGRVPPHNLAGRRVAARGHAAVAGRHRRRVGVGCAPDDFYKPAHGHIFDAITSLYGAGRAGRSGHRGRGAAPGRPARRHRRPGRRWSACRPPRRPRPTPAATPRSSRSTRCSAG